MSYKEAYELAPEVLNRKGLTASDVEWMTDAELLRIPEIGEKILSALREGMCFNVHVRLNNKKDQRMVEELAERIGGEIVKE